MKVFEYNKQDDGTMVLVLEYEVPDDEPTHEDLEAKANALITELQAVLAQLQLPF